MRTSRFAKRTAERRAVELLRRVGIPQPERRVDDYPHQFSGGMRQRAMIAMALALNPKLLIADEPTTALDVTVQAQIVELMKALQVEFGMAIILITHDLGVVAGIADDVLVMYAGRAMEHGDRRSIYRRPHHPYTEGLLQALPSRDRREGSADPDPRATAEPHQPPGGLPVPSALSLRDGTLPAGDAAVAARRRCRRACVGVLASARPRLPPGTGGEGGAVSVARVRAPHGGARRRRARQRRGPRQAFPVSPRGASAAGGPRYARSTGSASTSDAERRSVSSARAVAASRRSPGASRGSTT